jgi:hypothetical protein
MAAFRARYLQCRVRKVADGNEVLLEQPEDVNELKEVSGIG